MAELISFKPNEIKQVEGILREVKLKFTLSCDLSRDITGEKKNSIMVKIYTSDFSGSPQGAVKLEAEKNSLFKSILESILPDFQNTLREKIGQEMNITVIDLMRSF